MLEPPCKLDTFNAFWWKGVYCCCWIFWQVQFSIVGTWKTALTAFAEHRRSSCIMSYWRVFLQQHCRLHFWCQLAINANLYELWKPKSGKRLMLWDWWEGPLAEKKKWMTTLMCKTSKNRTTNLVSEWINIWATLFWLKLFFLFFYTYIRNLMPVLKLSVKYTQKLLQFFFLSFILCFSWTQRGCLSPWDMAFNRQVLGSSICWHSRTKGSINEGFIGYINNHLCLLHQEACDIQYH